MERIWTDEQKAAIRRPCGPLLVSAAAGSGKTAVLVERILQKISGGGPGGCDIDRLLVVTFTNAAAAEMRGKIAAAISDRLAVAPGNARLRRQMALLPKADIGTVHSFCLSLLRENFHLADLPPVFRVADETETELIKKAVMEKVLEERYETAQQDEDFRAAAETFAGERDDRRFQAVLLEIFAKLQSHPDPAGWMARVQEDMERAGGDAGETPWGAYLLSRAAALLSFGLETLRRGIAGMKARPEVYTAYAPAYFDDIGKGEALLAAAKAGKWDETFRLLAGYEAKRLASVRGFDDQEWLKNIKAAREDWKKIREDIAAKLIFEDSETALSRMRGMAPAVRGLFSVVSSFSKRYAGEKKRRKLVDFNDLEHLSLALLTEKTADGRIIPSALAKELSLRYREVLVDEYQDTNEVQDALFTALSDGGKRLFMVGDVKQSIYRFRLADPEVFLSKYLAYPDAEQAEEGCAARILLTKNFRSRGQVLDTVNFIFGRVMTKPFGGLAYAGREALVCGAQYENAADTRYQTELHVLSMEGANGEEDGEAEEKAVAEANFLARRIRALVDSRLPVTAGGKRRPVLPGDIAVLLRSVSGKGQIYEKALKALGIPCKTDDPGEFFFTAEILTLMSFLEILENAAQDVPLVSVMRCPAYGFAPEELAAIRAAFPAMPFHVAVQRAADTGSARCASLLSDLAGYRAAMGDRPVSRLVWRLLVDGGLLALFSAMEGGRKRRENLLAFYEYARTCDSMASGLSGVLALLQNLRDRKKTPAAPGGGGGDAVRLLSIHKSKGLEFPVAAIPDCAKMFNEDDLRRPVLFHPAFGVGAKARDAVYLAEYPTFVRSAVADRLRADAMEEELRVLYVAMTRAKEKLILTMALPDAGKALENWRRMGREGRLHPEALRAARSPAMWIAAPLMEHPSGKALAGASFTPEKTLYPMDIRVIPAAGAEAQKAPGEMLPPEEEGRAAFLPAPEALLATMTYTYPWSAAARLPSKLTPASLKGRNEDKEAEEGAYKGRAAVRLDRPDFAHTNGLTPAERGTAHHLAVQYMDFDRCGAGEGVSAELARLKERQILSDAQADAVDEARLVRFFASGLAMRMRKGRDIRKEFKFSLLCPADRFFPGAPRGERILLQGVADLMFEEPEGLVVVDFKTDRVRPGEEGEAAERYRPQLETYGYALARILKKNVKECVLYFFETGAMVTLSGEIGVFDA